MWLKGVFVKEYHKDERVNRFKEVVGTTPYCFNTHAHLWESIVRKEVYREFKESWQWTTLIGYACAFVKTHHKNKEVWKFKRYWRSLVWWWGRVEVYPSRFCAASKIELRWLIGSVNVHPLCCGRPSLARPRIQAMGSTRIGNVIWYWGNWNLSVAVGVWDGGNQKLSKRLVLVVVVSSATVVVVHPSTVFLKKVVHWQKWHTPHHRIQEKHLLLQLL